ncbi:MAG: hypothetical protein MUE88_01525 [Flavobacteriales bacterium]|jgi:hypothetical protein|nr:hypothetical protein [Flavobacteriales bacterium]
MIDHTLLDAYEAAGGDPARLSADQRHLAGERWTRVDELLLDLHMLRYGYVNEGYERHLDRMIAEDCADASVAERLRAMR